MFMLKIALLASCLALPVLAHEGEKHDEAKEKSAAVTMSGELVDMGCYMIHEGKGKKHAKCAGSCVTGGAPLGLLTKDAKVILIVGDHDDAKPFLEAKALAGSNATLSGTLITRGGTTALVVKKAEKL